MKLRRSLSVTLVAVATVATGCTTRGAPAKASAPLDVPPVVGTAVLHAAEIDGEEDAPRVGKPQKSEPVDRTGAESREGEPRRGDRRPGGGFSGYK